MAVMRRSARYLSLSARGLAKVLRRRPTISRCENRVVLWPSSTGRNLCPGAAPSRRVAWPSASLTRGARLYRLACRLAGSAGTGCGTKRSRPEGETARNPGLAMAIKSLGRGDVTHDLCVHSGQQGWVGASKRGSPTALTIHTDCSTQAVVHMTSTTMTCERSEPTAIATTNRGVLVMHPELAII